MTSEAISAEPAAEKPVRSRFSALINFGLVLLILFGIGCRFYNLAWDDKNQLHPDERFIATAMIRLKWPSNLVEYADYFNSSRSTLNPANIKDIHYVYGQIPLTLGRFLADRLGVETDRDFMIYGRALSGFFDCLTILFTVLAGWKLFGLRGGLLAGSLVALAALHIQQSHFYVVDTFAAAFMTLAFWLLLRWMDSARIWDAFWVGLAIGCAMACKISAFLFVFAVLPALYFVIRRFGFRRSYGSAIVLALTTLLMFRFGHPMAFRGELGPLGYFDIEPEMRFFTDLRTQSEITSGSANVPFNIQWIGRPLWLYSAENLALWGYGLLFCLAIAAGLLLVGKRTLQRRSIPRRSIPPGVIVAGVYFLGVFLLQGATFSKFTRYYLPITGAGALLAVYVLQDSRLRTGTRRWAVPVVVGTTAAWAFAVTSIYTREHTRLTATYWIRGNVPRGTVIANETAWDEGLPLGWVPNRDGTGYEDGLEKLDLLVVEPESEIKRQKLLESLERTEWIFISSPREWGTIPRWQERFPVMTEYYSALFDGRLGFRLEQEFTSYPTLGPLKFPDWGVEEALTVYDHPRVLLFRKTKNWSLSSAKALLEPIPLPPQIKDWRPREAGPVGPRPLPVPPGT